MRRSFPSTSERTPGQQPDGPDADPAAVARGICLRLLAGAARTRVQLAAALARRGVPDSIAEAVLDRFAELHLIDDAAYAEAFVANRSGTRAVGRRELSRALRERGVDAELAAQAVAEVDDAAAAMAFAGSRAARLARLPREVAVRRLTGQLSRRGYPSAVISQVVRETL